jgi:signal transduction histidine kinase
MPIEVALDVAGLERRLPPAVESTGFFVVSEALVNAVKHARASELAVTLRRGPEDRLSIEVRDDGIGGAGNGNGTRSIADRVEALGGRLRIDSATGAGTCVRVELPCGS